MVEKKKAAGVCAPSGSLVTRLGTADHSAAPGLLEQESYDKAIAARSARFEHGESPK